MQITDYKQSKVYDFDNTTDERVKATLDFINTDSSDWVVGYKTTRSGFTTNLPIVYTSLNKTVLIVEPTNIIITNTIKRDIKKYCDFSPNILHIASNMFCPLIRTMMADYPLLKQLEYIPPVMPCAECDSYGLCKVTMIAKATNVNIYAITYDKLLSLIRSSEDNEFAQLVLDRISSVDVALLDESHSIMYGNPTEINIKSYNEFAFAEVETTSVNKVVSLFNKLLKSDEYVNASDGNTRIRNPYVLDDEYNATIMGIARESVDIVKEIEMYQYLTVTDIKLLPNMIKVLVSDEIMVMKDDNRVSMKVKGESKHSILTYLDQFTQMRKVLTSATITSMDYNIPNVTNILFGGDGDPLKTNDKMTIFADSKTYSSNSKWSRRNSIYEEDNVSQITRDVCDIIEMSGKSSDDFVFVAPTIKAFNLYRKRLDAIGCNVGMNYFKGDGTQGTSSDKRNMITLCGAYKPASAYLGMVDNHEIKSVESMHEDVFQTWSRAKDPNGVIESTIYAIGMPEHIVNNCITWGINRVVEVSDSVNGIANKYVVKCDHMIAKPHVVTKPSGVGWRNFTETLSESLPFYPPNNYNNWGVKGQACIVTDKLKELWTSMPENEGMTKLDIMHMFDLSDKKARLRIKQLVESNLLKETTGNNNMKMYTKSISSKADKYNKNMKEYTRTNEVE